MINTNMLVLNLKYPVDVDKKGHVNKLHYDILMFLF